MKKKINILVLLKAKNKHLADSICQSIQSLIPNSSLTVMYSCFDALSEMQRKGNRSVIETISKNKLKPLNRGIFHLLRSKSIVLLIQHDHIFRLSDFRLTKFRYFIKQSVQKTQTPPFLQIPNKKFSHLTQEHTALNAMHEAVINCDAHGKITYLNRSAERLTGLSKLELIGMPLSSIMHIQSGYCEKIRLNSTNQMSILDLIKCKYVNMQLVSDNEVNSNFANSITKIDDESGNYNGAVIVFHSQELDDNHWYRQANYDWLTDLPNRALLTERLTLAINLASRNGKQVGLLFIDLDNFKTVNDSLGHESGDVLLKSVSRRLEECVRGSDTVSRYGGDEFTILLTEICNFRDCSLVIKKIEKAFSLPHQVGSKALVVNLSIGVSVFPFDADNSQTMIMHADQAMYLAKKRGGNTSEIFPFKSQQHKEFL